jgi:hypothetical protein
MSDQTRPEYATYTLKEKYGCSNVRIRIRLLRMAKARAAEVNWIVYDEETKPSPWRAIEVKDEKG